MKELRGLDLKRAQLVPSSVFTSPEEVVLHSGLSSAQKLAILRRWEFDARRTAGYGAAKDAPHEVGMLFRVRRALQALTSRDRGSASFETRGPDLPLGEDELLVRASVLASRNATGKF
jgi:hypothetical protein